MIAEVLSRIHRHAFPEGEGWNAGSMTELLNMPGADYILQPEGFILFRTACDEAEIITLAVLPENRRQGAGSRLVALMREEIQPIAKIFLEVENENEPALGLYKKLGFVQVGFRRNYYGPDKHGIIMAWE